MMQRLLTTLSAAAIGCSAPISPGFKAVSDVYDDGTVMRVNSALAPEHMPIKVSPIITELPNLQDHDNDDEMSVAFSTESTTVIIANTGGTSRLVSDGQETVSFINSPIDGTRQIQRIITLDQNYLPVFVLAAAIGAAGTVYFVLPYRLKSSHS
jgi:hypothetical protein